MSSTFTVYYDGSLWVGVLEVSAGDGLHAACHIFGAEPTGPQLLEFRRHEYLGLRAAALAAPPVPPEEERPRAINPKRAARAAAREQAQPSISTAAQRALDENQSAVRHENRAAAKRRRAAEADYRRAEARRKSQQRHRGH